MSIVSKGSFAAYKGVAFKRKVVPVALSGASPSFVVPRPGAYQFHLDVATPATIVVLGTALTVAETGGLFVWDKGGAEERTFTAAGEYTHRTYNGQLFEIGWLGSATQSFYIRAVTMPRSGMGDDPPPGGIVSDYGLIVDPVTATVDGGAALAPTTETFDYGTLP